MIATNRMKKKITRGKPVVGMFVMFHCCAIVEIIGKAGFDFIVIDMEHGSFDMQSVENLTRAAEVAGITPIVRVPGNEATIILRVLETGAKGVMVPHVDTAEEARKCVSAAKYAPVGARGAGYLTRAAGYFTSDPKTYCTQANNQTMIIGMIESEEGTKNIDAICSTSGMDAFFIGPYDLSQSLGHPGEVHLPAVEERIVRTAQSIQEKGYVAGIYVDNPDDAKKWLERGSQIIACGVDALIFRNGCDSLRGEFEEIRGKK